VGRFIFPAKSGEITTMKSHHYAVVTSRNQSTTRLGWKSPSTDEMYCGICMRGVISPEAGAVCPSCGSEVVRTFEVIQGGRPLRKNFSVTVATEQTGRVASSS
jgi:hypothetical protein